ncbi:helix-turn-helix domain-containing protein [Paenibacillus abyssi]|uniref:DNA-binding response regulator n=1 Tax=Paenibacillus abyssi TaxID=1340531 RepID=A0A917G4L6_9BACL|nr:helix-turn-helix domain-containing protein [Paenibacillus abyssi]GGG22570.1 hypothetical protein GCM10010916_44040 [Paenibacillus abyssi]
MHQVLLVDDEIHAVRGLAAGVNWEHSGISRVLTAHSKKQAQDIFASNAVDLMICDIEMPQGSGLELLEWVREHHPMTETIFLTCHSDFSFAKRAIHLKSFEYLLKPVDYTELECVIAKALDKVRKDREMLSFEETYKHYAKLWASHRPLLKERFWTDLIEQKISSNPEKIAEQAASHNLSYNTYQYFVPVYIRVQRWYKPLSQREEKIMEYALRNAAEEKIYDNNPDAAIIPLIDGLLLIAPSGAAEHLEVWREGAQDYINSCHQYFACDLCCYIGKPVYMHQLSDMLQTLQKMDANNVTCINEAFLYNDTQKSGCLIELPPLAKWADWMKQGAKEKVQTEVKAYLNGWNQARDGIDASLLHRFYQDFLQMVFFILQTKGLQANQVFSQSLLTETPQSVLRSVQALQEWVQYVMEVAMNHIHSLEGNISIVEKAKRFISEQIGMQELSREDVASHVFLNPDYLSRVFKKETGISISDYLQQQRIDYAKLLLVNTDRLVSDIALESGYSNLSYFSTIFKKATGMNPGDFRRQARS